MVYRPLNIITIKDKNTISVIDELLNKLLGAKFLSKLDLKAGYHQIQVYEEKIPKMAFWSHEGHYGFVVMLFGLTNALVAFQILMNDLLYPYLGKFILVLDDTLVYLKTWEEHLWNVFAILATN